jgi:TRAP-type C4-dicarboxylate transport system permease small subunit
MDYFAKLIHNTGRIVTIIGGALLVGIMLLIVANVFYRFFGGVIIGSYEIIELTIMPVAGFSLVYAAIWKTHVVVKILVSRFSKRIQAITESFASLLGIGLWGLMAWSTVGFFSGGRLLDRTEVLKIPFLPFRYVWVFGLLLFSLVILVGLYRALSRAVNK